MEAKWTHNKYIPTLEDYLNNAWRSVSGVVILTHGYFLVNKEMKKDTIESLEKYHELLKWSSTIFRLCNDLGTSSVCFITLSIFTMFCLFIFVLIPYLFWHRMR